MVSAENQPEKPEFIGWEAALDDVFGRSDYGAYGDDPRQLIDDTSKIYGVEIPQGDVELDEVLDLAHGITVLENEEHRRLDAEREQAEFRMRGES